MLKKLLLYFVVPLIFAVCWSFSPDHYGYGSYPIDLCSDNDSFTGYCLDCGTLFGCLSGINGTITNCTTQQACRVSKTFAACSDINDVPDCSCPGSGIIQKPDPYDDTKYFICSDGIRYGFQCPESEYYNRDTEECYAPAPTTAATTTENPCSGTNGNEVIKVNCTCYRHCLGESGYIDTCCDLGEIYNEKTQGCEFYYLFNCSGKIDGNYYVDTHNCSRYYLCVDQEIFGTSYCPENEVYDEKNQECSKDNSTCTSIPDCGVCTNDYTFIGIDCQNYYACEKNPTGDPEFTPVPKTCPAGFCFSQETTYCESLEQSHWSFSKLDVF